ncbi:MAG: hypothetical protein ACFE9L_06830 [Candidatus Hodarchaeota archaeon]
MVKLTPFFKVAILMVHLLSLSLHLVKGNPILSDGNFETIPLASDYDNTVYFKAEKMLFRFTSSRVFINANYTFANDNQSMININILLPFIIFKSNEVNPPVLERLMLDGLDLEYTWKTIQIPSVYRGDFQAIEFKLSFTGEEEKTIYAQYNRDYQDGAGSWGSNTEHYHFQYYVGTALAWNHSINEAYFEFWMPKSICDSIDSERLFETFEETSDYYIGSIHHTNWMPEEHWISIGWTNEVLLSGLQILIVEALVEFGVFFGIISLVFFIIKRKIW